MTARAISGWALLVLLGGATVGRAADDWQPLLNNSPFGQAAAPTKGAPGELEFRGVVQEEGSFLVNLYNPTTKTSQWVPVNGHAPGLEVKSYDAQEEKVQIMQGGRPVTLPLKQAKIALAKAPVLPSPGGNGDKQDDKDEQRRQEVRDMIRARLEGGGDPAQVIRSLPPEAQAMMEEFRRRRSERESEQRDGGSSSSKSGSKSKKEDSSKRSSR